MKKYKKIYIEITNNCNLKCSFCSEVKRKRRFMTTEEFENILKKIKDYTDYIYLHIKGEPLLHPNIIEFLHLADKYNLKVNLTTNGTLFSKVAKELSECKSLHKINFSLHSENNIDNYCDIPAIVELGVVDGVNGIVISLDDFNDGREDILKEKILEAYRIKDKKINYKYDRSRFEALEDVFSK